MKFLRQVIVDLNTPSDYSDDWYGWAIHHIAHTAIAMIFARGISDIWFHWSGEYPYRWVVGPICVYAFILYQWGVQRDRRTDVLNDIWFSGSGFVLAFVGFSEIEPGSDHLDSHPEKFWYAFSIWMLSFIPGIVRRLNNKRSDNAYF